MFVTFSRIHATKFNKSIKSHGHSINSSKIKFLVIHYEYHDKQPWMLLHKRSKKVPIISCWSALADKCIHTAIFRFINQVHEQDYIHWYSYSTLGITCVENRKTDSPIGGQGLRMTVIFQMRNNNHQLGQKSKGNTVNEVISFKLYI